VVQALLKLPAEETTVSQPQTPNRPAPDHSASPGPPAASPNEGSRYTGFEAIPMTVTVAVGHSRCRLAELVELQDGYVVSLDRAIGEPFELRAKDVLLGLVELVVDGEGLALKLVQVPEDDDGAGS
jgi:flagellar motor switch protein FliN/FliY